MLRAGDLCAVGVDNARFLSDVDITDERGLDGGWNGNGRQLQCDNLLRSFALFSIKHRG